MGISSAGIGSGLDVASIVNQLVAAERSPTAARIDRTERQVNGQISALGALRSAMAVGEVTAGFYLSLRPFNRHVGKTMFAAVAVFGLANLVFSLSTTFWLSFGALAIAGAADMVSVYIRGALVQFSTPDEMRGRVNAVNMLFIGSSNELGEFRAGSAAAALGAVPAAVTGAVCTLGVVAAWAALFKPLRTVDRFEEATPAVTR